MPERTRAVRVVNPWTFGGGGRAREVFGLGPVVILTGRLLGWLLLRHPVLTAHAATITWLAIHWHSVALAGGVVLAADAAAVLLGIGAWAGLGGPPVVAILTGMSRRRRVRARWWRAAEDAGITRRRDGATLVPKVTRLRPTAAGLRGTIRSGSIGRTWSDVAAKRSSLAASIGCREVYVRPGRHPGLADVEFAWGDALRRIIKLSDLPKSARGQLTFGLTEDGTPVSVRWDISTLIAGLTRSGKSGVIWALLAALVETGMPYRLVVIDPKGGMELRALKDVAWIYAVMPQDIAEALTEVVSDMRARAQALGDAGMRKFRPSRSTPLTIVLIDEFLALTIFAPRNLKARIERDVGLLVTQGGAGGFTCWFATQGTQLDALSRVRTFIPQAICMATDTVDTAIAALGQDARHAARCDLIDLKHQAGVGYMSVDGIRGYARFRAAWVNDRTTRRIARGELPDAAFTARPERAARKESRALVRQQRRDEQERVALYRWVGRDDVVLYIGISDDPDRRMGQHVDGKPWVVEAVRVEFVDWFDTREEALEAEEALIREELPLYNKIHNMDNPNRVDYEAEGYVPVPMDLHDGHRVIDGDVDPPDLDATDEEEEEL